MAPHPESMRFRSEAWKSGGVWSGLGRKNHPRSSPMPRGEAGEQSSRKVSRAPPPVGEGGLSQRWGQGNGLGTGSGASSFSRDPGAGRRRGARAAGVLESPEWQRFACCDVCWESRQRELCRVWDDARRHLHPPSLLQVGGGGGVARRGSVFLAVTLIRCCVGTCTESGWAFTSPVRIHFLLEKLRGFFPHSPHSCCLQGGIRRARLLSPRERGSRRRGEAASPGRENPALALRRAAECGAYARPASRGLVSICPFCLRVKFAGENPMIRAEPLGGGPPPPRPFLTDGKNDSVGQSSLPASINAAASVPGAWGGWAPRQETAKGGATRAACPFPG